MEQPTVDYNRTVIPFSNSAQKSPRFSYYLQLTTTGVGGAVTGTMTG